MQFCMQSLQPPQSALQGRRHIPPDKILFPASADKNKYPCFIGKCEEHLLSLSYRLPLTVYRLHKDLHIK